MAISFPSFRPTDLSMSSSSKFYSAQFVLFSPNRCPEEMVGVGGTWNQTSLESKCKVSIWEYPVGGSYVCSRGWEGREERWLPELHAQKCQRTGTHRDVLSTKQRESLRRWAFIWSELSGSWATADSLEHNSCCRACHYCCAFATSNTCRVPLHVSNGILRSHVRAQTSGCTELLKSNWRTQMKNRQLNRKQYSE